MHEFEGGYGGKGFVWTVISENGRLSRTLYRERLMRGRVARMTERLVTALAECLG
jgi:hypothetical protein